MRMLIDIGLCKTVNILKGNVMFSLLKGSLDSVDFK